MYVWRQGLTNLTGIFSFHPTIMKPSLRQQKKFLKIKKLKIKKNLKTPNPTFLKKILFLVGWNWFVGFVVLLETKNILVSIVCGFIYEIYLAQYPLWMTPGKTCHAPKGRIYLLLFPICKQNKTKKTKIAHTHSPKPQLDSPFPFLFFSLWRKNLKFNKL